MSLSFAHWRKRTWRILSPLSLWKNQSTKKKRSICKLAWRKTRLLLAAIRVLKLDDVVKRNTPISAEIDDVSHSFVNVNRTFLTDSASSSQLIVIIQGVHPIMRTETCSTRVRSRFSFRRSQQLTFRMICNPKNNSNAKIVFDSWGVRPKLTVYLSQELQVLLHVLHQDPKFIWEYSCFLNPSWWASRIIASLRLVNYLKKSNLDALKTLAVEEFA